MVGAFQTARQAVGGMPLTNLSSDTQEEPEQDTVQGGLSEETHLFAKFTSTYMIQDFLAVEERGGTEEAFPRNVVCEAAMVFSDLSGFSKLCESYVEKFAHMDSAGAAMSQAAEKLNVVVNRCSPWSSHSETRTHA